MLSIIAGGEASAYGVYCIVLQNIGFSVDRFDSV